MPILTPILTLNAPLEWQFTVRIGATPLLTLTVSKQIGEFNVPRRVFYAAAMFLARHLRDQLQNKSDADDMMQQMRAGE